MKVAIIGASGFIGSALLAEALERGHAVTAIVRHPEKITTKHANLVVKKGDVTNVEELAGLVGGQDAVINSFNAPGAPDVVAAYELATHALIAAVKKADVKRILSVGGAASLDTAPGQKVIDSPHFPEEWKPLARGTWKALDIFKAEKELDWTVLSPAALIAPGERTGKFRLGKDQLVVDEKGESRISSADYAVALIDELEQPAHSRQRFTLAY